MKKETLAQVFSCEFCEISKNTFLYRTPPVAASVCANDYSLHITGQDLKLVKSIVEKDFSAVTDWFYENFMILNLDKCDYMCIGKNTESDTFKIDNVCLDNTKKK